MGEDTIVGFESSKSTLVFWNIDDYPIPVDDLGPIFGDILKALDLMGFRHGYIDVKLYSEQHNLDKKESEIDHHYLLQCESYSAGVYKLPDITLYMIRLASMLGPGPLNFFVIAKSPNRELLRVLQCLNSRRHNVLLVEPRPHQGCPFGVDYLLDNARLLGGGKPRFKSLYDYALEYDMSDEHDVDVKEDVSKTVDFSERIPTVKGVRTAVFWDAEDCPFPLSYTPDEIYHSISSTLVAKGFSDKITIWAYLDDYKKGNKFLGVNKTWPSRIYFLPGGDNASRRIRMLNDIYLWTRDSPQLNRSYEAALVLVSHQFKDAPYYNDMLQKLSDIHYDLLLVTPTLGFNMLMDRCTYTPAQEEETLKKLIDVAGCPFGDETSEISEEPAQEETPEKLAMYQFDPVTGMYKSLKNLVPKTMKPTLLPKKKKLSRSLHL